MQSLVLCITVDIKDSKKDSLETEKKYQSLKYRQKHARNPKHNTRQSSEKQSWEIKNHQLVRFITMFILKLKSKYTCNKFDLCVL